MRILLAVFLVSFQGNDNHAILYEPSFISSWYEATANETQFLIIPHNLGEVPVKVDLQVKINETGKDYIFGGIGSSQRDDDMPGPMSGVVYAYNNRQVWLTVPYCNNGWPNEARGLAYTGSDGLYHGPTQLLGPYKTGYIRVRIWLSINMPSPVISKTVYMSNVNNFEEFHHNLGYYPDMVSVRTHLCNLGFYSDGIGALFLTDTQGAHNSIGGVLFAYDDTKIRLWVPSTYSSSVNHTNTGGVFQATDGYSLTHCVAGEVSILAWSFDCSQEVYRRQFTVGDGISHDNQVEFPCEYNLDNFFVSFQVKIPDADGVNEGMIFYGVGTTQANGKYSYGGVVYAYNEIETLFWRPNNNPVITIDGRWGSGNSSQTVMSADVIVRVFHLRKSECPYPDTISNATFAVTGVNYADKVTYGCDPGYEHKTGDLIRWCLKARIWNGYPPTCILITCPVPDYILNGRYSPIVLQYLPGDSITYECDPDYTLTGGSITRTCDSFGFWTGNFSVCEAHGCPIPDPVANANYISFQSTMSTSLYPFGSSIKYTCDTNFIMTSGTSMRTCGADGRWSGVSPTCSAYGCSMPDPVINASNSTSVVLTSTSLFPPGASITYTCDPGYYMVMGTSTRNCEVDGRWDGMAPACIDITCPIPDTVINASNSTSVVLTSTSLFPPGTSITYTCDPGYYMVVGISTRHCEADGRWDGSAPACIGITCPIPDIVVNGSYIPILAVYIPGDVITYQCNSGYSTTGGSISRSCTGTGKWDGIPPACDAYGCPIPDPVINASNSTSTLVMSTSLFPPGTSITYTCDPGYYMVMGTSTRHCEADGRWDGIAPACIGITCPIPDIVVNGSYIPILAVYIPGDVITYQCNSGYSTTGGSISRSCTGTGKWDGIPPACDAYGCPIPDPVINASNTTSVAVTSTFLFPPGTSITYTCDPGYNMVVGTSTRNCEGDGRWDGMAPACIDIICPIPDLVGNGSYMPMLAVYIPGDVITYNCNAGYNMTGGSVSRLCTGTGLWDGIPPACAGTLMPSTYTSSLSNEDIEEMITTLQVNKKTTSSYKRSLISVRDPRKSAQAIGLGGVVILITLFSCLLIPDITRLVKHCLDRPKNHK